MLRVTNAALETQAAHLAGKPEHLPQARPPRIVRSLQSALPVPPARLLLSDLHSLQLSDRSHPQSTRPCLYGRSAESHQTNKKQR